MKLKINKGHIKKSIKAPTSKSWANRFLIIAAIQKGPTIIENISQSTDVKNMLLAFNQIGLKVETQNEKIIIHNSFPACENFSDDNIINLTTGDGGTTNRFLLALLSRGKKKYRLITSKEFSKRPNDDFFDVLVNMGVDLKVGKNDFWVEIQGNGAIKSLDRIEVDCEKSTQFLSGLMLAYADENIEFLPKNLKSSFDYIEMTKKLISDFKVGKKYFYNPVDFSSLSYPIAFVCDGEALNIENCFEIDKFQADSFLFSFLENKGVKFHFSKEGLKVDSTHFDLKPFLIECSGFPDLVPTLIFIACLCHGRSTLQGLEVLKHKESDRFREICHLLKEFKIKYEVNHRLDEISVFGPCKNINNCELNLPPDHRMIIIAAMFLKKFGNGEINQIQHVNKSYPTFFSDFNLS